MKLLLLALIFCSISYSLAAPVESDYPIFLNHLKHLNQNDAESLQAYHFVLVAGFTNELAPKYLTTWQSALNEQGIDVTVIRPHSLKSVKQNVPYLKDVFKNLRKQTKKKLIVIGHSKGGLETLATLLEHPELADTVIERIITVQSPVCGCEMGDRSFNMAAKFILPSYRNGMASLTAQEVKAMTLDKINSLTSADAKKLSQRVFYVISEKEEAEQARLIRYASKLVGAVAHGDGLVEKKEMFIPGFGKIIGDMHADHMELAVPPMPGLNTSSIEKNRAFILALAKNILREINTKSKEARFCKDAFLAIYNQGSP